LPFGKTFCLLSLHKKLIDVEVVLSINQKCPNIPLKTESIQVPYKTKKSNVSQLLLLFFLRFHSKKKLKKVILKMFSNDFQNDRLKF
jgi:hypothetical protein